MAGRPLGTSAPGRSERDQVRQPVPRSSMVPGEARKHRGDWRSFEPLIGLYADQCLTKTTAIYQAARLITPSKSRLDEE